MKEIYTFLLQLLEGVESLNFIDLDKAQLDYYEYRPAVALPACLIKTEVTSATTIGSNVQRCNGRVTLRVGFDYQGETTGHTPESIRNESLAYFDLVQEIYLALQGKKFENHPLDRMAMVEETRQDGLKVINMIFGITWLDKSALKKG